MYENIGQKIMNFVTAIVLVEMAISIVGGLILASEGAGIISFIVMVVGCVISWIGGLVLYGFGRLIDNTEYLRNMHSGKITSFSHYNSKECEGECDEVKNSLLNKNENVVNCDDKFYFKSKTNEDIECPNCGKHQNGNRTRCWECGAYFIYEEN